MTVYAGEVYEWWNHDDPIPEGWEVDVENEPEGGQPNGVGTIEPSDNREWFSPERETHHRERMVITITGPWEEGPTGSAQRYQERALQFRQESNAREEERILEKAEIIRARREAQA